MKEITNSTESCCLTLDNLPCEIMLYILKQTDVRTVSVMCCVNTYFYKLMKANKWSIIDSIFVKNNNEKYIIPANGKTYKAYRYVIDFHLPHVVTRPQRKRLNKSVLETLMKENGINMEYIVINFVLAEDFLSIHWEKMSTYNILMYQNLPLNVILSIANKYYENHREHLDYWEAICRCQTLPLYVIDQYLSCINWFVLSGNKKTLTIDVLKKYSDKVMWAEVTKLGVVEELINEFVESMTRYTSTALCSICWMNISCYSQLSDEFIRKYINKLNIKFLLVYQNLKPDTIEELIGFATHPMSGIESEQMWDKVSEYQCLSYSFIRKHKGHLKLHKLISNRKISRRDLYTVFETTV